MQQCDRLMAFCLQSFSLKNNDNLKCKLAIRTYDYRKEQEIRYGQNVASTLLTYEGGSYVPNTSESQGEGKYLALHSERLSFGGAVKKAMIEQWGPFKDFSPSEVGKIFSSSSDALPIEVIERDEKLKNALKQLRHIDTYTDRCPCDYRNNPMYINSPDKGCTPYFEALATLLPTTTISNYHSIKGGADKDESIKILKFERSILESAKVFSLVSIKKEILNSREQLKNTSKEKSCKRSSLPDEDKMKMTEEFRQIQLNIRELNTREIKCNSLLEREIKIAMLEYELKEKKEQYHLILLNKKASEKEKERARKDYEKAQEKLDSLLTSSSSSSSSSSNAPLKSDEQKEITQPILEYNLKEKEEEKKEEEEEEEEQYHRILLNEKASEKEEEARASFSSSSSTSSSNAPLENDEQKEISQARKRTIGETEGTPENRFRKKKKENELTQSPLLFHFDFVRKQATVHSGESAPTNILSSMPQKNEEPKPNTEKIDEQTPPSETSNTPKSPRSPK